MKVRLTSRHFGLHDLVKEAEIPGAFAGYAVPAEPPGGRDEWVIDEDKLLAALPAGFLPVPVRRVLLGVDDEDGGTAHSGCTRFRPWAKYFDAYMLWLVRPVEDGAATLPEFRIEFTIQRREEGDEDFTDIGFGSSGAADSPAHATRLVESIAQNREWETEPGMPEPEEVITALTREDGT